MRLGKLHKISRNWKGVTKNMLLICTIQTAKQSAHNTSKCYNSTANDSTVILFFIHKGTRSVCASRRRGMA